MADKHVNLIGTKVQASTIADFYNRLKALRALNGGSTTVSFSAPTVGTKIMPSTITEVRNEVLATKSALSFLATVNITDKVPTIPSTGDLIKAELTAHPIEWQIGKLESACFAFFNTNRVTNKTTNYQNFNLNAFNSCSSFNSGNRSANYTANFTSQNKPHRSANHTANFNFMHNPNFGSVQGSHCVTVYAPNFQGFHGTFRHFDKTSFFRGRCTVFGIQYKPVRHTQFGANYAALGFWCSALYAPNFQNNFTAQFANQFGTQHGTVFTTQYATQHNPVCSSVHTAVKSSNCTTNNVANDTANFTSFAAVYHANHSSFTVGPTP